MERLLVDRFLSPDVIASIYDAALDPNSLKPLASILTRAFDVETAGIWMSDKNGVSEFTLTDDIVASQISYMDYYHKLDVWQPGAFGHLNRAILGSDTIAESDLKRTEFYNDFARCYGFLDPMGTSIDIGDGKIMSVSFDRLGSAQKFSAADKATFQGLIPHLNKAIRLRRRLLTSLKPPQVHGLDLLSFGVVICDANSSIVYANPAAEHIERTRKALIFQKGTRRLGSAVFSEAQQLLRLVNKAAMLSDAGNMVLSNLKGIPVLMVLVTPLPTSMVGNIGPGHAMVAIRNLDASPSVSASRLIDLFRLSPTQASIAVALYEGKSYEEIAVSRGVKISTLRTHFAEILNRTGTKTRSDLIRLLGLIPPLR